MKGLVEFINESLNTESLMAIIKRMMSGLEYSSLKSWNEDDKDKFDIQKENERLLLNGFNEDKDIHAIGTADYYNLMTGKDFDNLSIVEKSKFDTTNGDIIFIDKDNNVICKIDVKISDKFLGAISLGSLVNFDKDGYYLLICKGGKFFKLVSHKKVVDDVKAGKLTLNEPINKYKGYDVKWNGKDYTSEWFIKGAQLRHI